MYDARFMRALKGTSDGERNFQSLLYSNTMLANASIQILALNKRHEEVMEIFTLLNTEDLNDVRMTQLRLDFCFPDKTLNDLGVGSEVLIEDFYGKLSTCFI